MSNALRSLSAVQLKQAASLMEQIEKLEAQLGKILGGTPAKVVAVSAAATGKRKMSAAGRARIIAAQKARWAKFHAAQKKAK